MVGALGLGGCAQLASTFYDNVNGVTSSQLRDVDKHGAFPAVKREDFETLNLAYLIAPDPERLSKDTSTGINARNLEQALGEFRKSSGSAEQKKLHRNSVQDRILSVSTSRCNVFKSYLRRQQSDTNFLLGSATTIAGVVGALVPAEAAARNWAGAAGIFSGVQAEYNREYFSNLAAHVIVQGIENQQNRLLEKLIERRQKLGIDEYSMEGAIKDAIYYDGTCSTITGLSEASESIREVNNPGLGRAAEVMASVRAMQTISSADNKSYQEMLDNGKLKDLLKQTNSKSSPLVVSSAAMGNDSTTSSRVFRSLQLLEDFDATISSTTISLATALQSRITKVPEEQRQIAIDSRSEINTLVSETLRKIPEYYNFPACIETVNSTTAELASKRARYILASEGTMAQLKAKNELQVADSGQLLATATTENIASMMRKDLELYRKTVVDTWNASKLDSTSAVTDLKSKIGEAAITKPSDINKCQAKISG